MPTWTSVSQLSVILASGDPRSNIYANGRNRIGVTISIQPTDENGNPVQVDPGHLADQVWLIDYVDESTLNWNGDSGWSYTNMANPFTAIPGGFGEATATTVDDGGIPQVTLYVYCSPGVNAKAIGVRVKTDSGDTISSSLNGTWHSKVMLNPKAGVTYRLGDINWDDAQTTTRYESDTKYVTTDAWNYYLSLKAEDNNFVTFSVSNCFTDPGYDGFFASSIPVGEFNRAFFTGAYVWYHEPHGTAYYQQGESDGTIVNFPVGNKWIDYAKIYDREFPESYLCFSWVFSITGGDGWHLPNGPLTKSSQWFRPQIIAYDMYGNAGTFWVDGADISKELKIYDHPLS